MEVSLEAPTRVTPHSKDDGSEPEWNRLFVEHLVLFVSVFRGPYLLEGLPEVLVRL